VTSDKKVEYYWLRALSSVGATLLYGADSRGKYENSYFFSRGAFGEQVLIVRAQEQIWRAARIGRLSSTASGTSIRRSSIKWIFGRVKSRRASGNEEARRAKITRPVGSPMKKKGIRKQLLAIAMVFLFGSDLAESAETRQGGGLLCRSGRNFKAAVANNNKEAIAAMPKFPFAYQAK
jgi:hypothetical protein